MNAININLFHGNENAFDESTKFVNWMVILFKIIFLNELCGSHVLLLHIFPINRRQYDEIGMQIYNGKDKNVTMPMPKLSSVVFSLPNSCGRKSFSKFNQMSNATYLHRYTLYDVLTYPNYNADFE